MPLYTGTMFGVPFTFGASGTKSFTTLLGSGTSQQIVPANTTNTRKGIYLTNTSSMWVFVNDFNGAAAVWQTRLGIPPGGVLYFPRPPQGQINGICQGTIGTALVLWQEVY